MRTTTAAPAALNDYQAAIEAAVEALRAEGLSGYALEDALPPVRWNLVARYAWAIPNAEAIDALVEVGPIVEIGAGAGYWASLVAAAGGDIVAYDPDPPGTNPWCGDQAYFDVVPGDATTAAPRPCPAALLASA